MTEMLNKEFSRKSFVKGGGALIVGFSRRRRRRSPARRRRPTARSRRNGPSDLGPVDSLIAIHADNTASVKTGRVELGQGSNTGLMMIAAEELDMDMSR